MAGVHLSPGPQRGPVWAGPSASSCGRLAPHLEGCPGLAGIRQGVVGNVKTLRLPRAPDRDLMLPFILFYFFPIQAALFLEF